MYVSNELISKTFNTTIGNKQYIVKLMDDFHYTDPVDKYYTENKAFELYLLMVQE
jgi:hypothetical protein